MPDIAAAILDGYERARPLSDHERRLLPEAMVFGALAYVLAPWDGRVVSANWRRVRTLLDHPADVRSMIAG